MGEGVRNTSRTWNDEATASGDQRRTLRRSRFVAIARRERKDPSSWRDNPDDSGGDGNSFRLLRRQRRQGVKGAEIAEGAMDLARMAEPLRVRRLMILCADSDAVGKVRQRHAIGLDAGKDHLKQKNISKPKRNSAASETRTHGEDGSAFAPSH